MGCAISSREAQSEGAAYEVRRSPMESMTTSSSSASDKARRKEANLRRTSGLEDPLGIGKESETVSAPSRWLLVMGTAGSCKSTLIRQLKYMHDGVDEMEGLRYVKEVHKTALDASKSLIAQLPNLGGEMQAIAERVRGLRRRSPITPEVASDLKALWQDSRVTKAIEALPDPQIACVCKHFLPRIEDLAEAEYVPDPQDMLFLRIPTLGQQETRIHNFPGGPISVFEMQVDSESSIFDQDGDAPGNDLLREGLCGIFFIASVADASDRVSGQALFSTKSCEKVTRIKDSSANKNENDVTPTLSEAFVECGTATTADPSFKQMALVLKSKAIKLASQHRVHCIVLLTMIDKLYTARLSNEQTPERIRACLESQLRLCAGDSSITDTTLMRNLSLMPDHTSFTDFEEFMMNTMFPDDVNDVAVGLQEAVHLTLFCYAETENKMLAHKGGIPTVMMQVEKLKMADHIWMQSLPRPLPNPKKISAEFAKRLGKDSPDLMKANFWKALLYLSDSLGSFQPEYLGSVHAVPLLVCASPGALLIAMILSLSTRPSTHLPNRLSWQPVSQVAQKLIRTSPAIERYKFAPGGSYKVDAEAMNTQMQQKDLHPIKWLGRLRDSNDTGFNKTFTPGTYVGAFYVLSALDGFHVLLHHLDHSIVPYVKISNKYASSDEWKQIRSFGQSVKMDVSPECGDDWAAAKSWMGPDIADESSLSMFQKFMFGVISLRQRLDRKCTAMHDQLRYSTKAHAPDSLSSLGSMYTEEIITLGSSKEVQIIIVACMYNITVTDNLPAGMFWYPLSLFEARHYSRFFQEWFDIYSHGQHIFEHSLGGKQASKARVVTKQLRSSSPRGSNHGSADSGDDDDSDWNESNSPNRENQVTKVDEEAITISLLQQERLRLDNLWEAIRWTKRLLKFLAEQSDGAVEQEENFTDRVSLIDEDVYAIKYSMMLSEGRKLIENVKEQAHKI